MNAEELRNYPKLGFGLMRLPRKDLKTDIEQTEKMVDLFLESGFRYFDTAYVYPGSEPRRCSQSAFPLARDH